MSVIAYLDSKIKSKKSLSLSLSLLSLFLIFPPFSIFFPVFKNLYGAVFFRLLIGQQPQRYYILKNAGIFCLLIPPSPFKVQRLWGRGYARAEAMYGPKASDQRLWAGGYGPEALRLVL